MAKRQLTVDEIMAILPETPGRISASTDGLTPAELQAAPEADAWSINDVLAHLRACHDVLGGSLLRIVVEDHPAFKGVNPRSLDQEDRLPRVGVRIAPSRRSRRSEPSSSRSSSPCRPMPGSGPRR